ncbi:early activation antigen CD69-like [Hemitrygon akajei]|uniref:early activation antigen CD69-like n=1 Tax=Hemitrygon akajei TaxID=2704970 RepID=UPI003BFA231F
MDRSESHINVKSGKTDSRSPSRAESDVSYAEVNFKTISVPGVRTDRDGLTSPYSELNFRKEEPLIAEYADHPTALRTGVQPITAQTGPHTEQPKVKIRNKPYRMICLFCLVTSALSAIVAGLSIYVLQIRRSQITCDQNYQILCQFLTSDREQTCSKDWIRINDRCYYVSTFETSFHTAMQECSKRFSRLLEINSKEETNIVSRSLVSRDHAYWIGKCEDGEVSSGLLYQVHSETTACSQCGMTFPCERDWHFICEKSAPLFPDVPEKIQDLCQQPAGPI